MAEQAQSVTVSAGVAQMVATYLQKGGSRVEGDLIAKLFIEECNASVAAQSAAPTDPAG